MWFYLVFLRLRRRLRQRASDAGTAAIGKTRGSGLSAQCRVRAPWSGKTTADARHRRSASWTRRHKCSGSFSRRRSVRIKGRRGRIKAIASTDRRNYAVRREYQRPYYPSYSHKGGYGHGYGYGYGYGSRTVIVPRYITPHFVTVVPYRPYVYRPSIGLGVYYGSGGSYPYGYTPRGYYDPIVGRPYGGLRITGFSPIAQVFADGYYVGIVNDFDGVFQHLNLEAGPHQIEIREPGLQPIAFDVMVQAGRTITFRADGY